MLSNIFASQRGASDSVTDFSMLSTPTGAQNVSIQGFCGLYNKLKMGWYFQPSVVSFYEINR